MKNSAIQGVIICDTTNETSVREQTKKKSSKSFLKQTIH